MKSTLKKPYTELSPLNFIKWMANHKGGHAHEIKACASRWIAAEIARKRAGNFVKLLSEEYDTQAIKEGYKS